MRLPAISVTRSPWRAAGHENHEIKDGPAMSDARE
ncbi:MAG: hypothetical protein QG573_230, partial [Acidobacteriota bacterium]|nr:hypothetical protein [Acidobacteriota bacterium]